MKYLFDIGHPAEVHYFKHTIRNLEKKGHDVLVTARDKDVTLELLQRAGMGFICTGRNIPSRAGKIFSLFRNDFYIYRAIRKFKPDLIINFFSPFAAQAGWLAGVPVLGFHDTEIAGISIRLSQPFTDTVVVPQCYARRLPPDKTIRFQGYFELCHLHPRYFTPDPDIWKELGVNENEPYVLIRFVSHHAVHDTGYGGISLEMKRKAIGDFSRIGRVFVSSEEPLPDDLQPYQLNTPVDRIHDVVYYAGLCFGESATMSAESAMLGVPAVFLDQRGLGYTNDLASRYGLVFSYGVDPENQVQALQKGLEILKNHNRDTWREKREKLLDDTIDVTAFMTWLIENFPDSIDAVRNEPDFPLRFG